LGQYHTLTCADAGTWVSLPDLGAGLKAGAQVWSTLGPAVLAFLCAAGTNSHPRSLPWAPSGDWAGLRPMFIGDYANTYDTIVFDEKLAIDESALQQKVLNRQSFLGSTPRRRKRLQDLSQALVPILERVMSCRASDLSEDGLWRPGSASSRRGWREFVKVMRDPSDHEAWVLNTAGMPEEEKERLQGYYERIGIWSDPSAWQRKPVHLTNHRFPAAPDEIASAADGHGDALLWVNLDRREFVDPTTFGDVPDLAGVMNGQSTRMIMAMLYHFEQRGGGDLRDMGTLSIAGRWRGDRIVLLGSKGFKPKSDTLVNQANVRGEFTDVSGNALAYSRIEDAFCDSGIEAPSYAPRSGKGEASFNNLSLDAQRVIRAALSTPQLHSKIEEGNWEAISGVYAVVTPPLRVVIPRRGTYEASEVLTAGSLEVRTIAGQKIVLTREANAEAAKALTQLPVEDCILAAEASMGSAVIPDVATKLVSLDSLSQHERLQMLG
jgi:hypothetical protein